MTHSCVTRLIHIWHTNWLRWEGSGLLWYVWHDLSICVTWLIHMRDMTHSNVWHDSFIYVTWLIYMYDMTHSNLAREVVTVRGACDTHTHTHTIYIYAYTHFTRMWIVCVYTYTLNMCDKNHSYLARKLLQRKMSATHTHTHTHMYIHTYMHTHTKHVCVVHTHTHTHTTYVWHDSFASGTRTSRISKVCAVHTHTHTRTHTHTHIHIYIHTRTWHMCVVCVALTLTRYTCVACLIHIWHWGAYN